MSSSTLIIFAIILAVAIIYVLFNANCFCSKDRFTGDVQNASPLPAASATPSRMIAAEPVHQASTPTHADNVSQAVIDASRELTRAVAEVESQLDLTQGTVATPATSQYVERLNTYLDSINRNLASIDIRNASMARAAALVAAVRLVNAQLTAANMKLTVYGGPNLTLIRFSPASGASVSPASPGVSPADSWSTPANADDMAIATSTTGAPVAAPVGTQDMASLDTYDQLSPETRAIEQQIMGQLQGRSSPPLPSAPTSRCSWN